MYRVKTGWVDVEAARSIVVTGITMLAYRLMRTSPFNDDPHVNLTTDADSKSVTHGQQSLIGGMVRNCGRRLYFQGVINMDEVREYRPLSKAAVSTVGCFLLDALNPPSVTFDSPAIEVMTDMSRVPPATIRADGTLTEANHSMLARGVRLLIVVNSEKQVEGLITTTDTLGDKSLRVAQRLQSTPAELLVSDLMTPVHAVEAIAIDDVKRASVGHVVASLKADGRAHAIVVGMGVDGKQHLMGIFSASQVARQLGVPLPTHEVARTFSEIEAVIAAA